MNKPPKIGARTIKTALSVFCTIIILSIFKKDSYFFACVAAILCMQPTIEDSFKIGKQRLIGTFVGALIGLLLISLITLFDTSNTIIYALTLSIGIILLIYTCTILKLNQCVNIACVTYLAIVLSVGTETWLSYSFNRIFETLIGAIIGILINSYILVPKKEKNVS